MGRFDKVGWANRGYKVVEAWKHLGCLIVIAYRRLGVYRAFLIAFVRASGNSRVTIRLPNVENSRIGISIYPLHNGNGLLGITYLCRANVMAQCNQAHNTIYLPSTTLCSSATAFRTSLALNHPSLTRDLLLHNLPRRQRPTKVIAAFGS